MNRTDDDTRQRLMDFSNALINQQAARVVVPAQQPESGFWFGGGNMAQGPDGALYVVGRYRNAGDSRTGVASGTRGLELAIFRSTDGGQTFAKCVAWDKQSLNAPSIEGQVLSIEGSCLRFTPEGVELYVSTEKIGIDYPEPVTAFQKPGAGVWTIDVLRASNIEALASALVQPALSSRIPEHLHVKDPFYWQAATGLRLGFCSHPFNWSSSNTSVVDLPASGQPQRATPQFGLFPRGATWDVAMARGTCVLPVPAVGRFASEPRSLLFYCGGECVRPLQEHTTAVARPRGSSCEEIGGVAFWQNDRPSQFERLAHLLPMFISPYGTGCSRYVDVLATDQGFYATWQQSQPDLSQPLVLNFVSRQQAEALLEA